MDTIEQLLLNFAATAKRGDLLDGSRRMLVKHFRAIPQNPILADDDEIEGIVYYPEGVIENAYIVYKRDGIRLKASFRQRPIRHSYTDEDYWKKNQTWFSNSTVHQFQHSFWIKLLKNPNLKVLLVGH